MSIYTRDNLASSLSQQLEAALNRRQKYVENDAARRDSNVKAINSLVKSIAYAQEDDLDDRKKKLMAERNAALKAQEDANKAILEANERSLNAEQQMDGYRPAEAGFPDTETSAYQAAMMEGYRPSKVSFDPVAQNYRAPSWYYTHMTPDYADAMRNNYTGQGIPASAMQDWYRTKGLKHLLAMQNYGKGIY